MWIPYPNTRGQGSTLQASGYRTQNKTGPARKIGGWRPLIVTVSVPVKQGWSQSETVPISPLATTRISLLCQSEGYECSLGLHYQE